MEYAVVEYLAISNGVAAGSRFCLLQYVMMKKGEDKDGSFRKVRYGYGCVSGVSIVDETAMMASRPVEMIIARSDNNNKYLPLRIAPVAVSLEDLFLGNIVISHYSGDIKYSSTGKELRDGDYGINIYEAYCVPKPTAISVVSLASEDLSAMFSTATVSKRTSRGRSRGGRGGGRGGLNRAQIGEHRDVPIKDATDKTSSTGGRSDRKNAKKRGGKVSKEAQVEKLEKVTVIDEGSSGDESGETTGDYVNSILQQSREGRTDGDSDKWANADNGSASGDRTDAANEVDSVAIGASEAARAPTIEVVTVKKEPTEPAARSVPNKGGNVTSGATGGEDRSWGDRLFSNDYELDEDDTYMAEKCMKRTKSNGGEIISVVSMECGKKISTDAITDSDLALKTYIVWREDGAIKACIHQAHTMSLFVFGGRINGIDCFFVRCG